MGRISALTELTSLASDDYLVVLDSSANIAKKITVANAFGITDLGWTASGESWTYASWTSTTRIGTITVPTDATTKYVAGMRIKITQSTGGTKYGIITKVAATLLTIFFPTGTTLNNEAITSPQYSLAKSPSGFDLDPTVWTLEYTRTTQDTQASPTANTWYKLNASDELVLGIGLWYAGYSVGHFAAKAAGGIDFETTLSTSSSSETDSTMTARTQSSGATPTQLMDPIVKTRILAVTSQTTYHLISETRSASHTDLGHDNDDQTLKIWATCAYL